MDFFAVNGIRPVRLCEATREFAYDSLGHKYGLQTRECPFVDLTGVEGYTDLTAIEKYDIAVRRIAEEAPVRICDGEKISGAATLGDAIDHNVPARYDGNTVFRSVSHLTLDFETVLKCGINGIENDVKNAFEKYSGTDKEPFIRSCVSALESMRIWHGRYISALESIEGYEENIKNLNQVPFGPATNFYEAVQSIWFTFAFVRLCGNWPGIGRIDYLLGDYLRRDLAEGILTVDEARDILAHFFIKGCEWICGGDYGSGDAQHYQNILLAGADENGCEITNDVTYLVLDIIEELGISDFPTSVRIGRNTPEKLLRRVAEVIRLGGGVIAVYNEDLVIESLTGYGYALSEARRFANDGCWEVQVPGETYFAYIPLDALGIFQQHTLDYYSGNAVYDDFGSVCCKFIDDLSRETEAVIMGISKNVFEDTTLPPHQWRWKKNTPCTVISLFEKGCIEKGLSYNEGGPLYNVVSPHIGGLPDVVNSLYAIKKLVFDDSRFTFAELMRMIENDWEGFEAERQFAINKYSYYGNDNDEADGIAARIIDGFADACDAVEKKTKYKTPAGVSTFGRQIGWASYRMATAFGKKANTVLSGNFSPTPGTDKIGTTAILKSYCKSDLRRTVCGAALDVKLLPSAVNGDDGIDAIVSLLRGFVILGGHFMQPDIADTALLRAAQENPELYQNLSVRVSGWNARFVTLDKNWQDMIIAQMGSDM